jgi:hypothetical protein
MDRPLPNPRRLWLYLLPLLLLGVVAIVGWRRGAADQERRSAPGMAEAKTAREAATPGKAADLPPVPVVDFRAAVPPQIPAGHEGHGSECAACVAERGLAACREDYAQMEYARLLEQVNADGTQSAKLLEECRRFAAAVIKDWSHAKSRPELPADQVVAAKRQEILEPVLAGLPPKISQD